MQKGIKERERRREAKQGMGRKGKTRQDRGRERKESKCNGMK